MSNQGICVTSDGITILMYKKQSGKNVLVSYSSSISSSPHKYRLNYLGGGNRLFL